MDYGKLAFLKQEDMNKRLTIIENSSVASTLQNLIIKNIKEHDLTELISGFEYYFELKKQSQISLKLSFKLASTIDNNFTVKIFVDDVLSTYEAFVIKANNHERIEIIKNIPSLSAGTKKINIQIIFDTPPTDTKLNGMFIEIYGKGLVRLFNICDMDFCSTAINQSYVLNAKNCEIFSMDNNGIFKLLSKSLSKKKVRLLYPYMFSNIVKNDTLNYFYLDNVNNLYYVGSDNTIKLICCNVTDFCVTTEKMADSSCVLFLISENKVGYIRIAFAGDKVMNGVFCEIATPLNKPKKVFITIINNEKCLVIECNGKSKLLKVCRQLSETELNCLKFKLMLSCGGEY